MDYYNISDHLFEKASAKRSPLNGSFELTADCIFNCKMCYVHNCSRRELARNTAGADKWIPLLEQCEKAGLIYLLLTGGEPLMHKDFDEIYTWVSERHLMPFVNTNGYLIDEARMEFFKRYPPSKMNITLYGTSDSVYKDLCGIDNGFTKVDRVLHNFKDNGFNLNVNITVVKSNYDDLQSILDYTAENGFRIRATTYIFGTEKNCIEERLPAEVAGETEVEIYRQTHTEEECRQYFRSAYMLLKAGERIVEEYDPNRRALVCRGGASSYWVHSDGRFNFCGMAADDTCPNAFEVPFDAAWKEAVRKADELKDCEACQKCGYRFVCRRCYSMLQCEGICMEDVEDSYACKYFRARAEAIRRVVESNGKV